MQYRILEYDDIRDCHKCLDVHGEVHYIDIMVNGDINIDDLDTVELQTFLERGLIGAKVRIKSTHAYIEIGHGVEVIEQGEENE